MMEEKKEPIRFATDEEVEREQKRKFDAEQVQEFMKRQHERRQMWRKRRGWETP